MRCSVILSVIMPLLASVVAAGSVSTTTKTATTATTKPADTKTANTTASANTTTTTVTSSNTTVSGNLTAEIQLAASKIPTCAASCPSDNAGKGNNCSATDYQCLCKIAGMDNNPITKCIADGCKDPQDIQNADNYGTIFCSYFNVTPPTNTSSSSNSSSANSTSEGPSATATAIPTGTGSPNATSTHSAKKSAATAYVVNTGVLAGSLFLAAVALF